LQKAPLAAVAEKMAVAARIVVRERAFNRKMYHWHWIRAHLRCNAIHYNVIVVRSAFVQYHLDCCRLISATFLHST
jgi:hypothetical protein